MEKLTIKELGPYLPYGLKAEMMDYKIDYVGKQFDEVLGFHQWDKNCLYWSALTVGGSKPNIERIKPILRPLSDLTKEIEVNGKKFVPIIELAKDYIPIEHHFKIELLEDKANYFEVGYVKYPHSFRFKLNKKPIRMEYQEIQKLFEWHFDVFGLIEKGLAIDVNTL